LAEEACTELANNNFNKAVVLLKAAIEANPDDLGTKYDPKKFDSLDKESLEHGRIQLEKMLNDRPLMRTYLKPSDEIWNWAWRKYSEKIDGARIVWNASRPGGGRLAESMPPFDRMPGQIMVRNIIIDPKLSDTQAVTRKQMAFETLWLAVVFELHNIENTKDYPDVCESVRRGNMDEETFVKTMFFHEFKAMQLTRKWYVSIFLPHAKTHHLLTDPSDWYCNMWGPPESIFSQYKDKNAYPWNPWASYFSMIKIGQ
jgi:hypothetical protein